MTQASGRMAIVPAWAVDDRRLTASALRVLLAIGTYSDDEGWSYPAISTIAARVDLSRQHVHNAIKKLEELGYIERTNRTRPNGSKASNLYRILFDKPIKNPPESVRMMSTVVDIPCKPQFTSLDVNCEGYIPNVPLLTNPQENDTAPHTHTSKGTHARKGKTPAPESFPLTEEMIGWANTKAELSRLNLADATERWLNAMKAGDYRYVNWHMAWRNGMLNAAKWAQEGTGKRYQSQAEQNRGDRDRVVL